MRAHSRGRRLLEDRIQHVLPYAPSDLIASYLAGATFHNVRSYRRRHAIPALRPRGAPARHSDNERCAQLAAHPDWTDQEHAASLGLSRTGWRAWKMRRGLLARPDGSLRASASAPPLFHGLQLCSEMGTRLRLHLQDLHRLFTSRSLGTDIPLADPPPATNPPQRATA